MRLIVPLIIIIGVVIFQSVFIVQEISQAIVLQFGDPKKIITKAGLNFKLPIIKVPSRIPKFNLKFYTRLK